MGSVLIMWLLNAIMKDEVDKLMYQRLIAMGNLGGDPEMRYMPDGRAVTNFSLATNRTWNDSDGEKKKETTWIRVSVWGKQAEACNQYLSRGRQVLVEGRLKPDGKTGSPRLFTRQDGSSGASYEMIADVVRFVGSASDSDSSSDGATSRPVAGTPSAQIEDDEIPF